MWYRIQLTNGRVRDDYNEFAYNAKELKTYINECLPSGYTIEKIVREYKDGSGTDVTDKYFKA